MVLLIVPKKFAVVFAKTIVAGKNVHYVTNQTIAFSSRIPGGYGTQEISTGSHSTKVYIMLEAWHVIISQLYMPIIIQDNNGFIFFDFKISKLGNRLYALSVHLLKQLNKQTILSLHSPFAARMIIATEYMMSIVTSNLHLIFVTLISYRRQRIPIVVPTQKLVST